MNLRLKILVALLTLLVGYSGINDVQAQVDPKLKALGSMALYGTVGGLLMGTASLAFGTEPRAIAQGASLGLYAGLIFGGYVVISHMVRKRRGMRPPRDPESDRYPEGVASPYGEFQEDQVGDYGLPSSYRWNGYWESENVSWQIKQKGRLHSNWKWGNSSRKVDFRNFYLNLLNWSF